MKKLFLNLIILMSSAILFAQSHVIYKQDFESAVAGNELLGNTQVKNFNSGGGAAWTYDIAAGVNAISGSNSAHLNIQNPGNAWWGLQYKIENAALTTVTKGLQYNVTFKIKSSTNNNKFRFSVEAQSGFVREVTLGAANVTQVISINTSPMDNSGVANFLWAFGQVANVGDIWIDDIAITELPARTTEFPTPAVKLGSVVFNENFENANVGPDNNLSNIGNTGAFHFGDQSAWTFGLNTNNPISGSKSAYLNITNTAPDWWSLQYKVDSKFNVTQGLRYKVTFKIKSSVANTLSFKVQDLQNFSQTLNLKGGNEVETYSIISNMMDRSGGTANFIWGFGAPGVPAEVSIDDIVIEEVQQLLSAPYVADISYCQGATAVPLTATPESNNELKWYSTATSQTALASAPTPATTTPGTTTYYVAQVQPDGFESSRDAIIVTVVAAAKAGTDGTLNVGAGVTPTNYRLFAALTGADAGGTWSHDGLIYTYTVAATSPCSVSDTSIVTVFPSSFNVCSGTTVATVVGTSSLKFYAALTGGTAIVGTTAFTATKNYYITQLVGGKESTPRRLAAVTVNALPTTPTALVLTNDNAVSPATSSTAITAVGAYVGTNTAFKLTATAASASSYVWTLPSGVLRTDATGTTTDVSTTSTDGFIYVKFSAYSSTTPTAVVINVQSVNANGCISASKASASITRLLPTAPAAIVMTEGASTTAITSFAKYMGSNTELTLTATPSSTATSYSWELPDGVTQTSGGNSNVITVKFAGVTSSNTYNYSTTATVPVSTNVLRIGVKSVNGVGVSTTLNTALLDPTTTSTAKLLTLKAVAPAAPTALVLNDGNTATAITLVSKLIGQGGTYRLAATVPAITLASSFAWELPSCVTRVTDLGGLTNSTSTTSTDPFIYVKFNGTKPAAGFIYFGVKAVNGIGSSNSSVANAAVIGDYASSEFKLLKLVTAVPAVVVTVSGSASVCNRAEGFSYTITAPVGANSYLITAPAGSVVSSATGISGTTPNVLTTSDLTFKVVYNGTTAFSTTDKNLVIKSVNSVGPCLTAKSIVLTKLASCSTLAGVSRFAAPSVKGDFNVIAYPNPSQDAFRLEVQSSGKGMATDLQVYDMTGRLIEQGRAESNSVEIGSNYPTGIYTIIVNQGENTKTLRVIKK